MEYVNLAQAKSIVKKAMAENIPVMLWGMPGIGKSEIVAELAKEEGRELEDVRTSQLDSIEIKGYPYVDREEKTLNFYPPYFIRPKGKGILFLDELNLAPQPVLAACYQLILDRKVGEAKLGDGWQIVCAGNRRDDKSYTQDMGAALHSRMLHLYIRADIKTWTKWATKRGLDSRLIGFLNFKPQMFAQEVPKERNRCWPNPRAWNRVNAVIGHRYQHQMLAGLVGEGAASEFRGYLEVYSRLPSWKDILADPAKCPLPSLENPTMAYALASMWGEHVTAKTAAPAFEMLSRLPEESQAVAVRIMTIREDIQKTKAQTTNTKAFMRWIESPAGREILNAPKEEEE